MDRFQAFLDEASRDLAFERPRNLLIKAEWFADFVAKGMEDLLARLDSALLRAIGRGPGNRRTCAIKTNL